MTDPNSAQDLIGRTAVAHDGQKIGKIGQVYLDDNTGQPVWVTVATGMFGKEHFAPLYGANRDGDDLVLNVTKDAVKDAPSVDSDGHLGDAENDSLYRYYGSSFPSRQDAPVSAPESEPAITESEPVAADDGAMIRSEEQVHVGTEQVETGRARLRKYIVTENVTTTVPVSHEEVRLEREPIGEGDSAVSAGEITEAEHEVTLHAERPVVAKETVPVEQVRLVTDTVTEEQTVNTEVRKEQIDEPVIDTADGPR